ESPVRGPSMPDTGDNSYRYPDDSGYKPGKCGEAQRDRQAFDQRGGYRLIQEDRIAKITSNCVAAPFQEAFVEWTVKPETFAGELNVFLRGFRSEHGGGCI